MYKSQKIIHQALTRAFADELIIRARSWENQHTRSIKFEDGLLSPEDIIFNLRDLTPLGLRIVETWRQKLMEGNTRKKRR